MKAAGVGAGSRLRAGLAPARRDGPGWLEGGQFRARNERLAIGAGGMTEGRGGCDNGLTWGELFATAIANDLGKPLGNTVPDRLWGLPSLLPVRR